MPPHVGPLVSLHADPRTSSLTDLLLKTNLLISSRRFSVVGALESIIAVHQNLSDLSIPAPFECCKLLFVVLFVVRLVVTSSALRHEHLLIQILFGIVQDVTAETLPLPPYLLAVAEVIASWARNEQNASSSQGVKILGCFGDGYLLCLPSPALSYAWP